MKRSARTRTALAAMTATCTLFVAACGGSDAGTEVDEGAGSATGDGGPEITEISVGVQPFAEVSAFHLAMAEGLFEEQGLEVTPETSGGGGAGLIPGLVSGELQIAYSNYVSLIQAASEGLPLRFVRENDRPGVQSLYALADSGITEPGDLAGKRIAINGLGNIMELTTREALEEAGVDPGSVQFVELPPPDFLGALEAGQVDAAWLVEPFVTIGTSQMGVEPVLDVFSGSTEDLPVAGWITSAEFAEQNPGTLEAFRTAMDRAIEMAAEDPSLIAETVPTYTQISEDVAASLNPINFAVESEPSDIALVEQLMREHGFIEDEVDVEQLIG